MTLKVGESLREMSRGSHNSGIEYSLLMVRAADEGALRMDVSRDSKISKELDLGNAHNGGIQVLGCAISIDVSEEVPWFDGVVSGAGSSEVVCSRNWRTPWDDVWRSNNDPLTIMSDIDGIPRSENGENAGIIQASGVRGVVVGLEPHTESISM